MPSAAPSVGTGSAVSPLGKEIDGRSVFFFRGRAADGALSGAPAGAVILEIVK
jgi:hypothetical protein